MKTEYRDLTPALKTAIVLAWIAGVASVLGFLVGFFGAL